MELAMDNLSETSIYHEKDSGDNFLSVETPKVGKQESRTRQFCSHCQDTVLDIASAVLIFWFHIVTLETFVVLVIATSATMFYYYFNNGAYYSDVSWTLVTFAVISPMIMQIKQAFTRREFALTCIADIKALTSNIYVAHTYWQWNSKTFGQGQLSQNHSSDVLKTIKSLLSDLCSTLKLPTITRGRHRFSKLGRKNAQNIIPYYEYMSNRISYAIKNLHLHVEEMKRNGLPANEASRINQYNMLLQNAIERLLNIKNYRTPQATRSFTRVFILILPFFYGPYYVHISRGANGSVSCMPFALIFSIMTSMSMIGIFNVEKALEDPFTEDGLDDIRVSHVFQRMQNELDILCK